MMKMLKSPLALACTLAWLPHTTVAEDKQLETIVVTGGKLERNLQSTTAGINVVDAELIEANSTYNLSEALALTPNVSINGRGGFSIRGINAEGGPTSDTSTADTAGIIMDGAYFDADLLEMGLSLWDADQIQVYKGPQSTSQGKNSLAGTIIVDSNNPVFETEGSVRLGLGSDNTQISSLMYNRALSDNLAIRFAGERVYTDGQLENEFNGDKDEDRNDHINGRIKLLFQNSEDFSALLTIGQDKVEQGDDRVCGKNTTKEGTFSCDQGNDFKAFRDERGVLHQRVNYQTLKLEKELNDTWTLASITSHSTKDRTERSDADGMAPTNSGYDKAEELGIRTEYEEDSSISQEFRFTAENEILRTSFGYYYSQTKEERGYNFLLANPLDAYLPSFYQTTSLLVGPYPNGVSDTVLQTQYSDEGSAREATNHALFAELDWKLSEATTALFGLRYENEKNRNTAGVTATNINQAQMDAINTQAGVYFNAATNALSYYPANFAELTAEQQADAAAAAQAQADAAFAQYTPFLVAGGADISGGAGNIVFPNGSLNNILNVLASSSSNTSQKDNVNNVLLPKIGIQHQFSDDIGAGYVITRGYRSGGISLNPINTTQPTVEYDPEFVTNHELSLRTQWLDQRLTANANVYYMEWEDQQVQVIGGNIYDRYITNAGSSTLKGLEVDINFRGDSGLRLFANAGISKTRYEDFTTGGKDYSGNQFQYTPERTAAAGIGFDQGMGFNSYLIANHTGEMYLDNDNENKVAGFTLTNLRFGYAADVWKVNGYINNLFDKRATAYEYSYDAYTPDPNFVLYADYVRMVPKRSFGLVAQYDF